MKLVIVESPTKAKTLSKFLGKEYDVVASMGHVRDLPKKGLGIDVDDGFKVTYEDTAKAKKTLADIRKKAETAEEVFLATDPDREGEAIAWHLYNAIFGIGGKKGKGKGRKSGKVGKRGRVIPSVSEESSANARAAGSFAGAQDDNKRVPDDSEKDRGDDSVMLNSVQHPLSVPVKRVVFHEITKEAVVEAFENSRSLDLNLVDSQQARRVLDRLVGYKLSPLLWKKVRYGLSAGRVQSVAVRLIVDRELERQAFAAQEYWSVDGVFGQGDTRFYAVLTEVGGKKVEISTAGEVEKLVSELKKVEDFEVTSVVESEKKRNTFPAFTTSTLTQAASNRFGFTAKRTMQTAQSLFEAGLITYHRTDSFFLSASFIQSSREYISKVFGEQFLPEKPNYYKSKAKNIQEAHEAIRPTGLHPEAGVTSDEQKLYGLIWARAVASQMLPAVFSVVSVTVEDGGRKFKFKASSSVLKFEGWLKVYGRKVGEGDNEQVQGDTRRKVVPMGEVQDDNSEERDDSKENRDLARLKEKDGVELKEILPEQHFTQPPARYTEASLIKAMEEDGIGRPSTYAPTITTIQSRGYVTKDAKNFVPTDVAFVVTKMLKEHFPEIVDLGFTASMEENLDEIADGKEKWVPVIKKFYDPFISEVLAKDKELAKKDMTLLEVTHEICPKCGKNLNIKLGKFGRFKSCSDFPTCDYAEPILVSITGGDGFTVDENQLGKCPKCEDGVLGLRDGKFGKFVGCGNYPKCDFRKSYMEKIDMKCPTCGKGDVVIKKGGRFKKIFYGCSLYPECKYISNKDPRNDREGAETSSA